MSVMKESATQQLIAHIKSAMAVGKIAEIDSALSETSINPVQNKVVTEAIENAMSYKQGDTINIYGVYPCAIEVYNNFGEVHIPVTIPTAKKVPHAIHIDESKTSGYFSLCTDIGYIKVDNVDIHNIPFSSENHGDMVVGLDDHDAFMFVIELPMSSVTYQDGTAISGAGKIGFIDITATFEFE